MHDAFFVRGLERVGDLPGVLERRFKRQRAFERIALDQLHDQGVPFHSVDLRNVGMVERSQDLGLALEAGHALAVAGKGFGQHLERNVALQPGIFGAIDLAHAARADGRKSSGTQLRARR